MDSNFILMINPPIDPLINKENISFYRIGKHLFSKDIRVPEIIKCDIKHGLFILQDLGNMHLQDIPSSKNRELLYEQVIEHLIHMQIRGAEGFNTEWCYQTERYDFQVMLKYEAMYFLNEFVVNYLGIKPDMKHMMLSFKYIADHASETANNYFMHRDFQSRNIMIKDGHQPYFVDWQGARLGPPGYDLASLIIDPYVDLNNHDSLKIYSLYLDLLKSHHPSEIAQFERTYPYLAIQRNMQILGAFSYLGIKKAKPKFLKYISTAVRKFKKLLHEVNSSELNPILELLEAYDGTTQMIYLE